MDILRRDFKALRRLGRRPRSPVKEALLFFQLAHLYKMCHNWNPISQKDIKRTQIKIPGNNFLTTTLNPILVVHKHIKECTLYRTQVQLVPTCREGLTLLQMLPCNNKPRLCKYTNSQTRWADMAPACKKWSIKATNPTTAERWSLCCKEDNQSNNKRLVITRDHRSSNKLVETVISMPIRFSWTVIRAIIITRPTVKIMIMDICKRGLYESNISPTLEEQIGLLPENNLHEEPLYKENWAISRLTKIRWIKWREDNMVWFLRSTKSSLNRVPKWVPTQVSRILVVIITASTKPQPMAFSNSQPIHREFWTALVILTKLPIKVHQRHQLEEWSIRKLLVNIPLRWLSP